MTFSIVAVDANAEEVGVAIASCNWDARRVCRAQAGIGVIASQGSGNQDLLPQYFEKLSDGLDPDRILEGFKGTDRAISGRQIGMVVLTGHAAAYTGEHCMSWAGHRIGDGYTCQGNVLVGEHVIDAMAEAFDTTEGQLYKRLYAALSAGDAAGGDLRGKQSAGLVVKKTGYGPPGTDTLVDFAIEDHDEPVEELGRIVGVAESLVQISMLQSAFSGMEDETDRREILEQLRVFLEDKKDRRFLDAWMALAKGYHRVGDLEGSARAVGEYLAICPAMTSTLRQQIEKEILPIEWSIVLNALDPGVRAI